MPLMAIVAGSIALLLLIFMGASFLIAPNKANEWFGTWTTHGQSSIMLRLFGFVWIIVIFFFAVLIVGVASK
jgi:hypothetical protein